MIALIQNEGSDFLQWGKVFTPFLWSVLLAFATQLFKRLVEKPRATTFIIVVSSGGAAMASLSAHLMLTDLTPLTDNALIGISGFFGYYGAAIISQGMKKQLEARTGIKLDEIPVVRPENVVEPKKGAGDV